MNNHLMEYHTIRCYTLEVGRFIEDEYVKWIEQHIKLYRMKYGKYDYESFHRWLQKRYAL